MGRRVRSVVQGGCGGGMGDWGAGLGGPEGVVPWLVRGPPKAGVAVSNFKQPFIL